jgi:predicted metal-binding membrane protein
MNSAVSQIGDAAVQPVRAMRPERVAALSIAVLTLAGWLALALEAMRQGSGIDAFVKAICRPVGLDQPLDPAGLWSQFTLTAGFWVAMTLAMMLPTAAPMALSYAERAGRGELGTRAVSPLVLVAGYLTVWFGVSLLAAALQTIGGIAWAGLGIPPRAATMMAGMVVGAAGLYQFSDFKLACLSFCRHPITAGDSKSFDRIAPVFKLGLEQGRRCLGCCWAMMGLMLLAGAMNLFWMALFAIVMTAEKTTRGVWMPRAIGAFLLIAGFAIAASALGFDNVWLWMRS